MNWFQENQAGFSGSLLFDEPLAKHTYYRIGGPARVMAFPKSREDVAWLSRGIAETGIPFFILGQGSNILASDQGFPGLVIRASRLNLNIEPVAPGELGAHRDLVTGGSVAVSTLLRRASHEGWGGLDFLTGIPGSVGGAVRMNAGTHLGETQGRLKKVGALLLTDYGRLVTFEGAELKFSYRKNHFLSTGSLVWTATWDVELQEPALVKAQIDQVLARRKATQPIDFPSCGSVFKNPAGHSAWQVVDKLGLRGHRIGDAQFAEKHSNFIVNLGAARASDVRALIELAKTRARDELGILLEEEVIYLGL